jgi:hypothetical protein
MIASRLPTAARSASPGRRSNPLPALRAAVGNGSGATMQTTEQTAASERTIRVVRGPDRFGVGVVCITAKGRPAYYAVREIPCEIGGRGFAMHRLGLGTLYHVRIGEPRDCTCECKGYAYRTWCRHVLGLLALVREGKL